MEYHAVGVGEGSGEGVPGEAALSHQLCHVQPNHYEGVVDQPLLSEERAVLHQYLLNLIRLFGRNIDPLFQPLEILVFHGFVDVADLNQAVILNDLTVEATSLQIVDPLDESSIAACEISHGIDRVGLVAVQILDGVDPTYFGY